MAHELMTPVSKGTLGNAKLRKNIILSIGETGHASLAKL